MSDLEKDFRVQDIIDNFRNFRLSEEVARRDLMLMGLTETEIRLAMGQVVLRG
jgi:hypothetical protein